MTFSIIIPVYNKQDTILRTLDSISRIDYSDFEVIVVDDGSTDNSASIVQHQCSNTIKYFYKENGGVSSARNYGARVAEGKWLIFLDADDYLKPESLSVFYSMILKYKDATVIVGNYIGESSIVKKVRDRSKERMSRKPTRDLWIGHFYPRPGTFCCTREAFNKIGGFDERMSYFEDGHFGIQLIANNKTAYTPTLVMEYVQETCYESRRLHPIKTELAYYIPEIHFLDIWMQDWYYNVLEKSMERRHKALDENGVKCYKKIEDECFGGIFSVIHEILYFYRRIQAKIYK